MIRSIGTIKSVVTGNQVSRILTPTPETDPEKVIKDATDTACECGGPVEIHFCGGCFEVHEGMSFDEARQKFLQTMGASKSAVLSARRATARGRKARISRGRPTQKPRLIW